MPTIAETPTEELIDAYYDLGRIIAFIFPILEADSKLANPCFNCGPMRLSTSLTMGQAALADEIQKRKK